MGSLGMSLLKPSYLADSAAAKRNDEGQTQISLKRKGPQDSELINPKLKQFYTTRIKIKPFYTGGKIAVIDDNTFVCQCNNSINVIRTADNDIKAENDEDACVSANLKNNFSSSFTYLHEFETDLDEIISFDACPASKTVVTAHKSNLLRIWCLRSGAVLKKVKSLHQLPIGIIEVNKFRARGERSNALESGRKLSERDDEVVEISDRADLCWATISGSAVKVWHSGGNQMSRQVSVGNIASIGYAKWKPSMDSKRLFVAERNIYVLDTNHPLNLVVTLEGHYSQVTGIEFGEDGTMISGGRDKVIILWDTKESFMKVRTIPFSNPIEGLILTNLYDLYIAVNPSEIYYFDVRTKKSKLVLSLSQEETVTGFASIQNDTKDNFFISTHTSAMYEIRKPVLAKDEGLSVHRQYVGSLDEILSVVIWSESKVAVSNNTNVIKVYTLENGSCQFLRGHTDIVLSLSTNKQWLVSGGKDNKIIFWSSTSAEPQFVLEGHLASVTSVCFSPSETVVYSVSEDNFLKAWNQLKCLRSAVAHGKEVNCVHCSPNGMLVATGSKDKTAKIWDSETLTLVGTLKGHKKGVWDAKFSSWDQLVVTSSADTTIKLWSLSSFLCIQTLQGHLSSVLQSHFVNGGLQIISVSSDGSMKVWELKTSSCLSTEECGNDKIWTLDVSPDGSTAVTGSADSILLVWNDITETKVEESLAKRKKLIEDEQLLTNVMSKGKYATAFKLALSLSRPHTLLKIMRDIPSFEELEPVILDLEEDLKSLLLGYISQWNTNAKTSTEAQILLHVILTKTPVENLKDIETMQLLPYTQKHFQRLRTMEEQIDMLEMVISDDQFVSL